LGLLVSPAVWFYVTKFPFESLGDVRVFAVTLLRQLIELLDQLPTAFRPFICNFHIMTEIDDTHGSHLAITRWRRMFAELPEKLIAIKQGLEVAQSLVPNLTGPNKEEEREMKARGDRARIAKQKRFMEGISRMPGRDR
jgi:hypothetical protein